jgi:hypothetical protein
MFVVSSKMIDIMSSPHLMMRPLYAKSVAKVMATISTQFLAASLNGNIETLFVNDMVIECNEKGRVSEADEGI